MTPYRILIARFPGGNSEVPDIGTWLVKVSSYLVSNPNILWNPEQDIRCYLGTPVTVLRNSALRYAKENSYDLILMIDSDMSPDIEPYGRHPLSAQPFLPTALDYWLSCRQDGPMVIAAPYCAGPPGRQVQVFRWNGQPGDYYLERLSRGEAAQQKSINRCAAIGTGLILIDTRVCDILPKSWFYYEYQDEYEDKVTVTEDVTFTRDLTFKDIPVLVTWDSWAGHHKRELVGFPALPSQQSIPKRILSQLPQPRLRNENSYTEISKAKLPRQAFIDAANIESEIDISCNDSNGFSEGLEARRFGELRSYEGITSKLCNLPILES